MFVVSIGLFSSSIFSDEVLNPESFILGALIVGNLRYRRLHFVTVTPFGATIFNQSITPHDGISFTL